MPDAAATLVGVVVPPEGADLVVFRIRFLLKLDDESGERFLLLREKIDELADGMAHAHACSAVTWIATPKDELEVLHAAEAE